MYCGNVNFQLNFRGSKVWICLEKTSDSFNSLKSNVNSACFSVRGCKQFLKHCSHHVPDSQFIMRLKLFLVVMHRVYQKIGFACLDYFELNFTLNKLFKRKSIKQMYSISHGHWESVKNWYCFLRNSCNFQVGTPQHGNAYYPCFCVPRSRKLFLDFISWNPQMKWQNFYHIFRTKPNWIGCLYTKHDRQEQ